ncbi:MAG: polyketide synthase, partial [Myxococcales bacterium]|nr:polyketide synthase [Myxococcales bacterium]
MRTPIAIVGQSCLLPGASTPAELAALLEAGRVVVGPSPAGRFRLGRTHAMTDDPTHSSDRAWSDLGGYVDPSFVLDPRGLALPESELAGLDLLFHWVLHCGREAAACARIDPRRTGAIFGNLSFPTGKMAERAESVWFAGTPFARPPVDPRNRFMSGLPAHLLARALGLGGEVFTLDAACASSLYAIALACEALESGRSDAMLAGAVCRADDLFIHVGFCALGAMSRSGASRPFHAEADGLVPAEGAALFLLKRLDDAERDGDRVLGVIRAVGLANDGRGRGLVAPSSEGQIRAMRAAYAAAGLSPRDVAYVECHATGTQVGDAAEIASLEEVFGAGPTLPIGSLKANMGHPLSVAGAAGLMKLLHSLERGVFLPTPGGGPENRALGNGHFRVVRGVEPWVGPRRAALSAFGFGGNDAHLIVEAPGLTKARTVEHAARSVTALRPRVAVVALAARVGDGASTEAFQRTIVEGTPCSPRATRVEVPLEGLRTPPRDLEVALAQQTMLLTVASEVARATRLEGP